jgi:hypothetical protein
VLPQAAPVLEPTTTAEPCDEAKTGEEIPLELNTREMRAALRGPASGEKAAKSVASWATSV